MDDITNIKTNPSSVYPKEEMMDNITMMNTNPFSGYPKEEMMDPEEGFVFMLVIVSIISPLGYPEKGFVLMLVILSIISSFGYPEEGFGTLSLGILKGKLWTILPT
jgi:hypothetical protein